MDAKESLEYELYLTELPGIIFLLIVCVVGTIGNFHVILVYTFKYKPSNHRILIVGLSCVDFIACIVAIPTNIDHFRHYYSTSNFVCSLFLPHFVSFASVFLLATIAIERFRKVCQPLKRQFSSKQVIISCFIVITVSIILSLPAFVFYGSEVHKIDTVNITVLLCAFPKEDQDRILVHIYNLTPPLFGSISIIICLVVYSIIGRLIYTKIKSNEFSPISRHSKTGSVSSVTSSTVVSIKRQHETGQSQHLTHPRNGKDTTTEIGQSNFVLQIQKGSDNQNEPDQSKPFIHSDKRANIQSQRKESTLKRERREKQTTSRSYNTTLQITLMLIVATALSYIFYLVSVIFLIILSVGNVSIQAAEKLGAGYIILENFFTLSNAINPIVYALFDPRFRKQCVHFYRNILFCCKIKR